MDFKILTDKLLDDYTKAVKESPLDKINKIKKLEMPVDYFQFYKSVSSVYSSKIEGEDIDFDSYFKHKFMKVKFNADYTKKADDLYAAYDFIDSNKLTLKNYGYISTRRTSERTLSFVYDRNVGTFLLLRYACDFRFIHDENAFNG